jgi:hypothetical protein
LLLNLGIIGKHFVIGRRIPDFMYNLAFTHVFLSTFRFQILASEERAAPARCGQEHVASMSIPFGDGQESVGGPAFKVLLES